MEHPIAARRDRRRTEPDPELLHIEQPRAGRVFEALNCPTRRRILSNLWDRPLTASEIADRVDCSVQNAHYHLRELEDSGLVGVVDTTLSDRGCRMDLYAPAEVPVVIAAPDDRRPETVIATGSDDEAGVERFRI